MGSINTQHVALLAFPFGTHAAPLFTLARALSVASPTGTAFSFLTSAKSAASFSESVTDNLKIFQVSDGGSQEGHAAAAAKNEHDPEAEVGRFMKETPGNFKKAMEDAVKGRDGMRITCVISDAFIWFAGEIAAELGAPWVALWTGGPCSLSAHLYTDTLREKFRIDDKGKDVNEVTCYWRLGAISGVTLGITGGEREIQRTMLELLNQLDGFDSKGDVKVILATNKIESLDPALLRSGCIDWKIEFPLSDIKTIRCIFQATHTDFKKAKEKVMFKKKEGLPEGLYM